MAHTYKPGDVALVRSMRGEVVVAVRTGVPTNMGWAYSMEMPDGSSTQTWSSDPDGRSVVRPLVVIDPEDRAQVERLEAAIAEILGWTQLSAQRIDAMQAALRSLVEPPRPDEPQGRYAVVVARDGTEWMKRRTDGMWSSVNETAAGGALTAAWRNYADIDVVRVLSEGVQP